MRSLVVLTLTVAVLVPAVAAAQQALPTPRATYDVTARVQQAVDDQVEGVTYLRVRLTLVTVKPLLTVSGAPTLGTGTTVSAIVRDTRHAAILKSLNQSLDVDLTLGWYDEGTYEVTDVLSNPTPASAQATSTSAATSALSGPILLLAGLAVLSLLSLWVFRSHRGRHP